MTAEKPGASQGVWGGVRRWLMRPWSIALLVAGVLALILMFQNLEPTPYRVLFWKVSISRVVALLMAFLAGAAAGALVLARVRKRR
jgi:uncharacterized integral membrane protein